MSPRPPSERQLGYLKGLGYRGTPPVTSGEASTLITQLKDGMSPEAAEQKLLDYREGLRKHRLERYKEYLHWMKEVNEESGGCPHFAGFRLKVFPENEEQYRIYHKAFLPLDVACKYPDFFVVLDEEMDCKELVCKPRHGKFIEGPGRVVEVAREAAQRQGCAILFCGLAVIPALIAVLAFL